MGRQRHATDARRAPGDARPSLRLRAPQLALGACHPPPALVTRSATSAGNDSTASPPKPSRGAAPWTRGSNGSSTPSMPVSTGRDDAVWMRSSRLRLGASTPAIWTLKSPYTLPTGADERENRDFKFYAKRDNLLPLGSRGQLQSGRLLMGHRARANGFELAQPPCRTARASTRRPKALTSDPRDWRPERPPTA